MSIGQKNEETKCCGRDLERCGCPDEIESQFHFELVLSANTCYMLRQCLFGLLRSGGTSAARTSDKYSVPPFVGGRQYTLFEAETNRLSRLSPTPFQPIV